MKSDRRRTSTRSARRSRIFAEALESRRLLSASGQFQFDVAPQHLKITSNFDMTGLLTPGNVLLENVTTDQRITMSNPTWLNSEHTEAGAKKEHTGSKKGSKKGEQKRGHIDFRSRNARVAVNHYWRVCFFLGLPSGRNLLVSAVRAATRWLQRRSPYGAPRCRLVRSRASSWSSIASSFTTSAQSQVSAAARPVVHVVPPRVRDRHPLHQPREVCAPSTSNFASPSTSTRRNARKSRSLKNSRERALPRFKT
jgi:hypothetical protein